MFDEDVLWCHCDGEPSQHSSQCWLSMGLLWDVLHVRCVWMLLLCSAIVWDVWKHYELCLTQRRLALPLSLIGSCCYSRMWSVSESERLRSTAKLLIRQQVVQVILLDLYSASALLRMLGIHMCVLWLLHCFFAGAANRFSIPPITIFCFITHGNTKPYKLWSTTEGFKLVFH